MEQPAGNEPQAALLDREMMENNTDTRKGSSIAVKYAKGLCVGAA